jgi:beta-glucanase (GH16 family)
MESRLWALVSLTFILNSAFPGQMAVAGTLLTNPGFEIDPQGQTTTIVGWRTYGANTFGETDSNTAHSGTNFFKVSQAFNGGVNYNGVYQDNASGPGASYSADGWAYTSIGDTLAGQNVAWIEVTFRDARGNMLALYRSALITTNSLTDGTFPPNTWVDLPVTNQYNPANFQLIGTVTSLVAPPNTSFVRYQLLFQGDVQRSTGSVYFDDLNLIQISGAPYGDWNIIWSDEFGGTSINRNIWTYDVENGPPAGWGNSELEYYTTNSQNSYVSNGLLHIVALRQATNGFSYTSARMKTQGLFSHTFGRFEFRAKLPSGIGMWPALWMLGTNIPSVGWPACGEFDITEVNGANPTLVQGSIHSGSDATQIYTLPGGTVTDFHTYLLEWTPIAINWFVDGVLYETQTSWASSLGPYPAPFDRPFFILMNLAVGGNYVGNPSISTINANTTFPSEMQVDYVRIYDHTGPLVISIAQSNSNVVLTWPTNIVCHLQSQSDSDPAGLTTNWTDVAGTTYPLVLPPTNGSSFYRLVSP